MGTCALHPTPLAGCPRCDARPCEHLDCGRAQATFHEAGRWYCARHAPSQVARREATRPQWAEENPTGHGVYVLQLKGNALRCLRDYDSGELRNPRRSVIGAPRLAATAGCASARERRCSMSEAHRNLNQRGTRP